MTHTQPLTNPVAQPPQVLPSNLNPLSSSTYGPNPSIPPISNFGPNNSNQTQAQSLKIILTDPNPTNTTSQTSKTLTPQSITKISTPATTTAIKPPENQHKMQTRAKNIIQKPNTKYTLTVALQTHLAQEPATLSEALKNENWCRALSDEFDYVIRNQTFDLVPLEPTQNIVGCKWVFKNKLLSSGDLDRYKARLVAKGFNQRYGVDYSETFSLVIKTTTLRLVLGVSVRKSWPILQLDVNNAFVQGTLTEEVYMSQLLGFIDKDRPDYACRLKKPIYRLNQAPRAWYLELKTHLLNSGFTNSLADASLFIYNHNRCLIYVLIYVDDILVTGNQQSPVTDFVSSLAYHFSIKDPADLHYFLGIEATRTNDGLHLMQQKYILDLLNKPTCSVQNQSPLPYQRLPSSHYTLAHNLMMHQNIEWLSATFNTLLLLGLILLTPSIDSPNSCTVPPLIIGTQQNVSFATWSVH